MENIIVNLQKKVINQKLIPTDKSLQTGFFNKIVENLNELHLFCLSNELNQDQIQTNMNAIQSLFNTLTIYPFNDYVNGDVIARIEGQIYVQFMSKLSTITPLVITQILSVLNNYRTKSSIKDNNLCILIQILKQRKNVLGLSYQHIQEIFITVLKIQKQTSDVKTKQFSMHVMKYLIQEKITSNELNKTDVIKNIRKYLQEKNDHLKKISVSCLKQVLMQANVDQIVQNFDFFITVCFKILEENSIQILKQKIIEVLSQLFLIKITYVQQDSKTKDTKNFLSVNMFGFGKSQQQTVVKQENSVDQKDIVKEIIELIFNYQKKYDNLTQYLFESLYLILLNVAQLITINDIKILYKKIFGLINLSNQKFRIREFSVLMVQKIIQFFSKQLNQSMYKMLIELLTKAKKENLSDQILLFILKSIYMQIHQLNSSIFEIIKQPDDIYKIVQDFLGYNNHQIKMTASHILNKFVEKNPKWKSHFLSIIMSFATIQYAQIEVLGIKNTQDIVRNDVDLQELSEHLYGHIICLCLLLGNIDSQIHSITFCIVDSIFETAKTFLLQNSKKDTEKYTESFCLLQICGWKLLEELLGQESQWVSSRLKTIFLFWENAFKKENIKEYQNYDEYIIDLRVKIPCITSIKYFLKKCNKFVNDSIQNLFSEYLIQFYQIFILNSNISYISKGEFYVSLAKHELYSTFQLISPQFYQPMINNLIQKASENVFTKNSIRDITILKDICSKQECNLAKYLQNDDETKSLFIPINYPVDTEIQTREEERPYNFNKYNVIFKIRNFNSAEQCKLEQMNFMAYIFKSQSFSLKNKLNFLTYLYKNIKSILQIKDSSQKDQKLLMYLMAVNKVTHSLYEYEGDSIIFNQEILSTLRDISFACWGITNNYVILLSSIIFAKLFKINNQDHEILFKLLFDNITNQLFMQSISAIIGYICKYNSQKSIQDYYLHLMNIFQKASRIPNNFWFLNSLNECFLNYQYKSIDLYKACINFMFNEYILQDQQTNSENLYLLSSLIYNYLNIHLAQPQKKQLEYQTCVILNDINIGLIEKQKLKQGTKINLNITFTNMGQRQHIKQLGQLMLETQNIQLVSLIVQSLKIHQDFISFDQELLLQKLNYINNLYKKNKEIEDLIREIYQAITLKSFQDKKITFENQFNYFKKVLYMDRFKEEIKEEQKQEDQGDDVVQQKQKESYKINIFFKNSSIENEITLSTRVYALKCTEQILEIIQLQKLKNKEIISFTNSIIEFLFKVITSLYEELRENGLRLFLLTFRKLKQFDENGEIIKNNEPMILLPYAAQIDAIIHVNLKNELTNYPEINLINFKLLIKFYKMVWKSDPFILKKLINMIAKPMLSNLKLLPSQYYSEKSSTIIHLKRIECLCKLYQFFKSLPVNEDNENYIEIKSVFSPVFLKFLYHNIIAFCLDSTVILTNPRQNIKNYQYFYFIYNGANSSYDKKLHFQSLNLFINTIIVLQDDLKQENVSIEYIKDQESVNQLKNNIRIIPSNEQIQHFLIDTIVFLLCNNDDQLDNNGSIFQDQLNQLLKVRFDALKNLQKLFIQQKEFIQDQKIVHDILKILKIFVLQNIGGQDFQCIIIEIMQNLCQNYNNNDIFNLQYQIIDQLYNRLVLQYLKLKNCEIEFQKVLALRLKIFAIECEPNQDQELLQKSKYISIKLLDLLTNGSIPIRSNISKLIFKVIIRMQSLIQINNCEISCEYSKFCLQFLKLQLTKQQNDKSFIYYIFLSLYNNHQADSIELNDLHRQIQNEIVIDENYSSFIMYCRTSWQEQKQIDQIIMKSVLEIVGLRLSITDEFMNQNNNQLNDQQNMTLIESLKLFLVLYVIMTEEEKIDYFQPFITIIFLFVDRRFDQSVLIVTNQVLKHVINTINVQKIQLENLPQKIKDSLKVMLQQQKQAQDQNQEQVQQQQQQKQQNNTIKLKFFGAQ